MCWLPPLGTNSSKNLLRMSGRNGDDVFEISGSCEILETFIGSQQLISKFVKFNVGGNRETGRRFTRDGFACRNYISGRIAFLI